MRNYITQNELNKLILEELKKVQESRGAAFDLLASQIGKYGQAAGDALRRVFDEGGEEAAERFAKSLGDAPTTTAGAVRRMADAALQPAATRAAGDVIKPGSMDRLRAVGSNLTKRVKDNPKTATAAATAALAGVGATASLAGGGGAPEDAPGGGGEAPSGGDKSTGRPVPGQSGSLPPTSGGEAMDPAWERYIQVTGSKSWSNPEEARAVYDAWQDYVKSPQPVKEQQGQYTSDFASFKAWWQSQGNAQLGPKETISILKGLTADPEAPADTVDGDPEVKPAPEVRPPAAPAAPAAATKALDGGPVTPLSDRYEKNLALLKKAQAEYAADEGERSFTKSVVINKYPALKGSFAVGKGGMDDDVTKTEILRVIRLTMEKEAQQYKRLRDRELRQMQRKTKRLPESVINESVYNRWQTLIKN